mmetsp:Transcript_18193/g.32612  ORF Transcript_18193/g.32612 Transcript_18193/m.32612 type:complete len:98 (+) Transcript_18193:173-466(+)
MGSVVIKRVLISLLGFLYTLACTYSVKKQLNVFNKHRMLEICFYTISVCFACKFHLGDAASFFCFAYYDNYYVDNGLRMLPDLFEMPICAVLSYFWY